SPSGSPAPPQLPFEDAAAHCVHEPFHFFDVRHFRQGSSALRNHCLEFFRTHDSAVAAVACSVCPFSADNRCAHLVFSRRAHVQHCRFLPFSILGITRLQKPPALSGKR